MAGQEDDSAHQDQTSPVKHLVRIKWHIGEPKAGSGGRQTCCGGGRGRRTARTKGKGQTARVTESERGRKRQDKIVTAAATTKTKTVDENRATGKWFW